MQNKLKIGIIGCGGIATSKHAPGLEKLGYVELSAFCSSRIESAQKMANTFGSGNSMICTDYRKLLEDGSIDAVHICTPNNSHAEIAIAALEAGKHVMCEKPMATSALDARKMAEAAKKAGKSLSVSYQSRFRPDSQYLHELCARGDLGEIYFAKAHAVRRRAVPNWGVFLDRDIQGGGPLIDIGTHALDLTLWVMNNYKPKSVMGSVHYKLGKKNSPANLWGSWDAEKYTVEDSAFGFITMENGATIILESSWALNTLQEGEACTTLCGTLGGADMQDGLRINGEEMGRLYTLKPSFDTPIDSESPGDMEMRLWAESLLNGTQPPVKAEEALVVSEILEAIYKSAETGKPVYFGE